MSGMKRSQPLQCIVLRTIDIGEADRLCVFFTREAGRKSARARGVRKLGSRLGGTLLPFRHISIELVEGNSSATVVSAVDRGDTVPPSGFPLLVRIEQGVELLLALTEEDEPLPAVFDLLLQFIRLSGSADARPLLPFQLRLLHLLGLLPANDDDPRFKDLPQDVRSYVQACTKFADLKALSDLLIDHPFLEGFVRTVIEAQLMHPLKSEGIGKL